ncbi:MAG: DUF2950 family protein [Sulfurifustis sp.]
MSARARHSRRSQFVAPHALRADAHRRRAGSDGRQLGTKNVRFAEAGVDALVEAVKANDETATARHSRHARRKVIELRRRRRGRANRAQFVAAYYAAHKIESDGERQATLVIGEDEWPLPIPLVGRATAGVSIPKRRTKFSTAASAMSSRARPHQALTRAGTSATTRSRPPAFAA